MKIKELAWPAVAPGYDEDLLLDVRHGTVAVLIRGRNAWHSTWVRHYLRNSTLYSDVSSAQHGAENQRGRGNVFYIVDAPALVLTGQLSHVVLCDAHPDNPFAAFTGLDFTVTESVHGRWIDGIYPGVSVRDAVDAFHHRSGHWSGPLPDEHSLRTGMLSPSDPFDEDDRSMRSLVSRAIGTNYFLAWDTQPRGNRYSRGGAKAVASRWTELARNAARHCAQPSSKPENLRRYRREVLQAMPRSQWLAKKSRAEAEERSRRTDAALRWRKARGQVANLADALQEARAELEAAGDARMRPASTSAGVRKQRERFEAASLESARLARELSRAEAEATAFWNRYTGADPST